MSDVKRIASRYAKDFSNPVSAAHEIEKAINDATADLRAQLAAREKEVAEARLQIQAFLDDVVDDKAEFQQMNEVIDKHGGWVEGPNDSYAENFERIISTAHNDALEKAAKACEAKKIASATGATNQGFNSGCDACVAAIRALKDQST